jgi:hypothetical protein
MALASPPSPAISELQAALAAETSRRIAAEKKYKDLETELEDLSATLFEQANEMVATERKEKAKLEARLKILEERDAVGQKRLEMVESALTRIERVKKLLDGWDHLVSMIFIRPDSHDPTSHKTAETDRPTRFPRQGVQRYGTST